MLDLAIRNGLVIDGSGSPGFRATVGVSGDRLSILRGSRAENVEASREIDATGLVVCPGFIDMHAHSGIVILDEPQHEPKLAQGVTTEVIGVDGNSYAPFQSRDDLEQFIRLNAGLDGTPRTKRRWETVDQYLALFDHHVAVNVAYLVGNSVLRINTVGWDARPASKSEIADMRAILREAMAEGAYGISTGLDYPPGSYADTDELVSVSQEAAVHGGLYHTHVRYSLGDRILDPFREALEIGRRAGVHVHITHFYQRMPVVGSADKMLGLVESASTDGIDVTFDSYPYTLSSSRLLILVPQWAHDGGPDKLLDILKSPEARERLRRDITFRGPSWQDMYLTNLKQPDNHAFEGRSIAEVAAMLGRPEADCVCDLLISEELGATYVAANGNGSTLQKFVAHPLGMVGSDAVLLGDFPSPRTYGTFPIILGEFVRAERFLGLPSAISKMTHFAAQTLGLRDRGLIADGMFADVVIFDPETVGTRATRRSPKPAPTGIPYVIVNGVLAIDGGHCTGRLAGRALRRGR